MSGQEMSSYEQQKFMGNTLCQKHKTPARMHDVRMWELAGSSMFPVTRTVLELTEARRWEALYEAWERRRVGLDRAGN